MVSLRWAMPEIRRMFGMEWEGKEKKLTSKIDKPKEKNYFEFFIPFRVNASLVFKLYLINI